MVRLPRGALLHRRLVDGRLSGLAHRSDGVFVLLLRQAVAEGRSILDPAVTDRALRWLRGFATGTDRPDMRNSLLLDIRFRSAQPMPNTKAK